jgi:hypothetical protein
MEDLVTVVMSTGMVGLSATKASTTGEIRGRVASRARTVALIVDPDPLVEDRILREASMIDRWFFTSCALLPGRIKSFDMAWASTSSHPRVEVGRR